MNITKGAFTWISSGLICIFSSQPLASESADTTASINQLSQYSVPTQELSQNRAKQGHDVLQQINHNDQGAWLEQNQLQSELTGNNYIHEGALQGIEGIATIIQNTGNQVIIQDATLLNLTVAP